MKRTEMVRLVLNDAAHGEIHPLIGLIDWLVYDKKIPIERLILIAKKKFGIPVRISYYTHKQF